MRTRPKKYKATMPLRELIYDHYFQRDEYRFKGRPVSESRRRELHSFLETFSVFHSRPPLVSDLTPEVIVSFSAWCRERFNEHRAFKVHEIGRALCRFVGSAPITNTHRGRKTRTLSDAPGTLWNICQTRYFKTNIDIRNKRTRDHYRGALCDFKEALGHEPMPEDLSDENVAMMMIALAQRGLAPPSVNDRRKRIRALWEWAARKRIVKDFPTIRKVREPHRTPRAWTLAELERLFHSCEQEPGLIVPGVPAAVFWPALHLVLWDTSERIGAILAMRWDWLNSEGVLEVPYHARKGQDSDALYVLRQQTLDALATMRPAGSELIFPWPLTRGVLYSRYNRILWRAGLPMDRKSKTHRMRRSVASHLQARGYDASIALGHSSSKVTKDSYLDPLIVGTVRPAQVLPAIGMTTAPALLEYSEK